MISYQCQGNKEKHMQKSERYLHKRMSSKKIGGMWRSGNSPVTNTGMDPAGDKNVGSSPGLGSLACGTFSEGRSSGVFSGYSGFLPLFKIITDADN